MEIKELKKLMPVNKADIRGYGIIEFYTPEQVVEILRLLSTSNNPCFGVVEMAVHDFFTSHNSFQEITDQEGKAYTMEFLEANKELLCISDDC